MKKIIAIMLLLFSSQFILSHTTTVVFADDYSGMCGDDLYWFFDLDSETLTISGTGEMDSYSFEQESGIAVTPWSNYSDQIKNLVLSNGITSIGSFAFYCFNNLKSVTIPKSVTCIGINAFSNCNNIESISAEKNNPAFHSSENCLIDAYNRLVLGCKNSIIPDDGSIYSIGESAFEGCTDLIEIKIPEGIIEIEPNAFSGCKSLNKIILPNSLMHIDKLAFSDCTNLPYITIPNNIWSIDGYAFSGCDNLDSISVDYGNKFYYSSGNCIIDSAYNSLIVGCKNSIIPNDGSIKSIGRGAFYRCSKLTNIVIPEGVVTIGEDAFSYCNNLETISIPNSLTTVEEHAFLGCNKLKYEVIDNALYLGNNSNKYFILIDVMDKSPSDYSINSNVIIIYDSAFKDCYNLKSVTLPNSLTSIGCEAFCNCTSLSNIIFPESIKTISRGAFQNCRSLLSIVLPDGLGSIDDYTFAGCCNLSSIVIPKSVHSVEIDAFSGCDKLTDVYYKGSKKEWNNNVIIEDYNELLDAAFHYNYSSNSILSKKTVFVFIGLAAIIGIIVLINVVIPRIKKYKQSITH